MSHNPLLLRIWPNQTSYFLNLLFMYALTAKYSDSFLVKFTIFGHFFYFVIPISKIIHPPVSETCNLVGISNTIQNIFIFISSIVPICDISNAIGKYNSCLNDTFQFIYEI